MGKLKFFLNLENFEEMEEFLRKFYTFYEKVGKFNLILVRLQGIFQNLKLINNEMCQRILVKYWEKFQSIFKILQFLQKC